MPAPQIRFPAVFMRGGTCKGVFFHRRDLPLDREDWAPIFLAAIGSPDPYERQLDGMGGGLSSLSKVVVLSPSERPDADVDYTFAQVSVAEAAVHYRTICGNLTAAVATFAVDEGLVRPADGEARVRIYNTNTDRIIVAALRVMDGEAVVEGDFAVAGVAGTGAPIRLDFLHPGGAGTGRLLPTGRPRDRLDVPGLGSIEASLVDAANPCVFVRAEAVGVSGDEPPQAIDADLVLMERLESIRRAGGVLMGFGATPEEIGRTSRNTPKVTLVAPPRDTVTLDGRRVPASAMDLSVRTLNLGRPHRALPLTNGLCIAAAAAIEGSVVNTVVAAGRSSDHPLRIGTPSGVVPVMANVERHGDSWSATSATVFSTARRLMEGHVLVPRSRIGRGVRETGQKPEEINEEAL